MSTYDVKRRKHDCGTEMLLTRSGWICPICLNSRIVPDGAVSVFRSVAKQHPDWCIVSEMPAVIPCPECEGEGEIECSKCDGTGSDKCCECGGLIDCPKCDGSGFADCGECDGTGKVEA